MQRPTAQSTLTWAEDTALQDTLRAVPAPGAPTQGLELKAEPETSSARPPSTTSTPKRKTVAARRRETPTRCRHLNSLTPTSRNSSSR
jgi:hypothetical protein